MMTAAVLCVTATAVESRESMTSTTVIEQGSALYDESALKTRMTRDLEQALQKRGYDVGGVDGIYDAKTASAVRAYQRDTNMAETGEASSDLLRTLGVDTTIASSYAIEQKDTIRFPLANKGSENSNIYDDPNANRTGVASFRQRYDRISERSYTPMTTTTVEEVTVTRPLNR
jgi:peptidoglycan hydrolase-like protein with peptidoglycan-binding domain